MKIRKTTLASKVHWRYPRYQHLSELSLTYEGRSESMCIHPPDISAKGMFINTNAGFPEGSVLKLRFRLARTGTRIAVRCEVRYCLAGVGVGVEFVDLPPACARAIETEIGASSAAAC